VCETGLIGGVEVVAMVGVPDAELLVAAIVLVEGRSKLSLKFRGVPMSLLSLVEV
jgi:hypothetical protein